MDNPRTTTITLPRTGQRPLRFRGCWLAHTHSRTLCGPSQNRWHEYTLYVCVSDDSYVLCVTYVTQWQGEDGRTSATVYRDEAALVAALPDLSDPDLVERMLDEIGIDTAEDLDAPAARA